MEAASIAKKLYGCTVYCTMTRRRFTSASEQMKALGYENVESASWALGQEAIEGVRKYLTELGIDATQQPFRTLGKPSPTRNFALAYLSEPRRTSENSPSDIVILSSKNNALKVLH